MSTKVKRKGVYIFLFVESILFGCVYFLGPQGMHHVVRVKKENGDLDRDIATLRAEVAALEHTVSVWKKDPFYQEKIARERLQMARKGDEIYYLM